ncbi:hypothetical protein MJ561_01740 [Klebsiella pneumoniae]|nr:hypothetical protein MJ561_01740 [Klebsiella pneumoniae]
MALAHMTHMHIPHNSIDAGLQLFALLQALIPTSSGISGILSIQNGAVFKRAHQRRNADLIFDPRLEERLRRFLSQRG